MTRMTDLDRQCMQDRRHAYLRGWEERGEVTDEMVERAAAAILAHVTQTKVPDHHVIARVALTAAFQDVHEPQEGEHA